MVLIHFCTIGSKKNTTICVYSSIHYLITPRSFMFSRPVPWPAWHRGFPGCPDDRSAPGWESAGNWRLRRSGSCSLGWNWAPPRQGRWHNGAFMVGGSVHRFFWKQTLNIYIYIYIRIYTNKHINKQYINITFFGANDSWRKQSLDTKSVMGMGKQLESLVLFW
jgi:hypothetical protein